MGNEEDERRSTSYHQLRLWLPSLVLCCWSGRSGSVIGGDQAIQVQRKSWLTLLT